MAVMDVRHCVHPGVSVRRIITMGVAIFVAELIAMAAVAPLSHVGAIKQAFIDAAVMIALSLPIIHWALIGPLIDLNRNLTMEVAEREKREIEVRRAQTMYLELFENVFDGVFEVAPDGTITRINSSLVKMLGYDHPQQLYDALNSAARSPAPPMDGKDRVEWARRLLTEGALRNLEAVLRRRDGMEITVVANVLPVRDDSGNVLFFQGTLSDISDRTRSLEAERRARKSAETLRAASVALTRSLDLDQVLDTLLELLHDIIPFDRAEVLVVNERGVIVPRARREQKGALEEWEGRCPQALLQEVMRLGVPVLIPDVTQESQWCAATVPATWLGVPLATPTEKLGLYAMYRRGVRSLSREHTAIADALGAAVAVAVRNASLFDEVASARLRLQVLSRKLLEMQEEDRRRIARELHDEAGQALTSLRIGLQLAEQESAGAPHAVARCRDLRQVVDGVMESLHTLATRLRPPGLEHLGLTDAIRQHLRSVAAHAGLEIDFKTYGLKDAHLSAAVEIAVYRIVQEAVTNVIRHAGAHRVIVRLERKEEKVRAEIRDDGRGFDPDETGGRLGISGMRERAELLGGSLTVRSSIKRGTTIVLEVPNGNAVVDR